MKYTVELQEQKIKETLEIKGDMFTKEWDKTMTDWTSHDKEFYEQLENAGYLNEDFLDAICESVDSMFAIDFADARGFYD